VKEFAESIHGQAASKDDADAGKCESCNRSIHSVKAAGEANSAVAAKTLPDTCTKCLSDAGFLPRHKIPVAHLVDSYKQSVHGRAIAAGSTKAAKCNDRRGNHDIYPARDARSHVNHSRVPETCATCHKEIAKTYDRSVHREAVQTGVKDAPVCVDCHGEHLILSPKNPNSPVNGHLLHPHLAFLSGDLRPDGLPDGYGLTGRETFRRPLQAHTSRALPGTCEIGVGGDCRGNGNSGPRPGTGSGRRLLSSSLDRGAAPRAPPKFTFKLDLGGHWVFARYSRTQRFL
jgi:hypothetical protein